MSLQVRGAKVRSAVGTIASSLGALAFLAMTPAHCDQQPATLCGAENGEMIARYVMIGSPTEVMPGSGACANVSLPAVGEPLGVAEFLPDPTDPSGSQIRSMAIQVESIGDRVLDAKVNAYADPALMAMQDSFVNYPYAAADAGPALPPGDPTSTDRVYSWGFFNSIYPDDNGICTANLAASDVDYPDIPAHVATDGVTQVDDQPETHIRYEWSNVQVIVQGVSQGQQIFANLTITQDGCQAKYNTSLLYPRVTCNAIGADGGLTGLGDPTQCDQNAVPNAPNPTYQQLYGSGLPATIAVECDNLGGDPDAGADDAGNAPAPPDWECLPSKLTP